MVTLQPARSVGRRMHLNQVSLRTAAVLICSAFLTRATGAVTEEDRVIEGMLREQASRYERVQSFTRVQHYIVTTARFGLKAERTIRLRSDRTQGKSYEVISQSGSPVLQSHVIDALIGAEIAASQQGNNLLTAANYSFKFIGSDVFSGHPCYILATEPKFKDKRLLNGRIWVDREHFGIIHVEGRPSLSLSLSVGKPMIVQDYTSLFDGSWVTRRHSYIDNLLFGKSELLIEYSDYQFSWREPRDQKNMPTR